MDHNKVDVYRSSDTGIMYYVQPMEGDTYEKGCIVSWQPEGEDKPQGAFALEPELINMIAELVYDLKNEKGMIAFVESLGLTAAIIRGRADEMLAEQATEA